MFLKVIEQHTFAATDLQYALKRDLRQQFPHPMKEVLGKVYADTITTVVFRIPTKVRWFCHVFAAAFPQTSVNRQSSFSSNFRLTEIKSANKARAKKPPRAS